MLKDKIKIKNQLKRNPKINLGVKLETQIMKP